jgi:hypothetical protein
MYRFRLERTDGSPADLPQHGAQLAAARPDPAERRQGQNEACDHAERNQPVHVGEGK